LERVTGGNSREIGSGDGPKNESGVRVVPLPPAVQPMKAWRAQQAADRLA
jgi:hypothetical protein